MALPDVGVYLWVGNSLGPLGDGKIPASPTWKLYMIQDGVYTPSFNTEESFTAAIDPSWIVAQQTVVPGALGAVLAGESIIPNTDFPFLTGPSVGALILTVSGTIERLYAHWGRANGNALPFTPNGLTRTMVGLRLLHTPLAS